LDPGGSELESATSKFAQSEKLGQGGFGAVYKGFLKDLIKLLCCYKESGG